MFPHAVPQLLGCPVSSRYLLLFKTQPSLRHSSGTTSSVRSSLIVSDAVTLFLFCHFISQLWEPSSWDQFEFLGCVCVCVWTHMHSRSSSGLRALRSEWLFSPSSYHLHHPSPGLGQRRYSVCAGRTLRMPEHPAPGVHLQSRRLGSSPSLTAKSHVTLGKSLLLSGPRSLLAT